MSGFLTYRELNVSKTEIEAVLRNQPAAVRDPILRDAASARNRRRALAGFRCTFRSTHAPAAEVCQSRLSMKSKPDVFARGRTVRHRHCRLPVRVWAKRLAISETEVCTCNCQRHRVLTRVRVTCSHLVISYGNQCRQREVYGSNSSKLVMFPISGGIRTRWLPFGSVQMDTAEAGLLGRTQGASVKGGAGAGKGEDPYLYKIRGNFGASNPTEISFVNPDQVKLVANTRCRETAPNPLDCHWQVLLPLPHLVVGLIADPVKIWEYDLPNPPSPGVSLPRATAIRLIYQNYDPSKPVKVVQASPGTRKRLRYRSLIHPYRSFGSQLDMLHRMRATTTEMLRIASYGCVHYFHHSGHGKLDSKVRWTDGRVTVKLRSLH